MMKGGLGNMMKQAQQMQENMKRMQEELGNVEVEGQAGAGLVRIVMNCHHAVRRVTIDPSLMNDDKEMLEDLIAAALNDGNRRIETAIQEKMGGLGLPPGFKLPF